VAKDPSPLKIAFVIKAMGNPGGGAERVLAAVSSGLADRGHDVTIITSDPPDKASFYPLAPLVRRVFLGVGTVERNSRPWDVVRRIWRLRRKILSCEPDVVVAFMHSSYIPVGMALAGSRTPVVASEHIGPEHYRTRPFERALVMLTPLTAQKITVVQSRSGGNTGVGLDVAWLSRQIPSLRRRRTTKSVLAAQERCFPLEGWRRKRITVVSSPPLLWSRPSS